MSAAVAESSAKGRSAGWQDQVYDLLRRHDVTQFAYVPDAGHEILIDRSLADGAVQGFDPEAQLAAATRLVERLAGRKSFAGYRELLDSAGAKVLRRGFSPGTVRTACRAVWERTTTTREA